MVGGDQLTVTRAWEPWVPRNPGVSKLGKISICSSFLIFTEGCINNIIQNNSVWCYYELKSWSFYYRGESLTENCIFVLRTKCGSFLAVSFLAYPLQAYLSSWLQYWVDKTLVIKNYPVCVCIKKILIQKYLMYLCQICPVDKSKQNSYIVHSMLTAVHQSFSRQFKALMKSTSMNTCQ